VNVGALFKLRMIKPQGVQTKEKFKSKEMKIRAEILSLFI